MGINDSEFANASQTSNETVAGKAMPPVTIVVPAYNLQDYLDDCVRSIQAQSYSGDLVILILDDGSTDGTLSAVQSHR